MACPKIDHENSEPALLVRANDNVPCFHVRIQDAHESNLIDGSDGLVTDRLPIALGGIHRQLR